MASALTPIATTTLGSAASSITFSSIPATYTHLRVVFTGLGDTSGNAGRMTVNSDTGTNYSRTQLLGDGATAYSNAVTNSAFIALTTGNFVTYPWFVSVDIFNYAGSTYKTMLLSFSSDRNGTGDINRAVNLWRSTSAITSIQLTTSGGNYTAGSTATLFGIKAA